MTNPFSRRATIALVLISAASFLAALGFSIFADDLPAVPSAGSDSFSRSALGHRAFVDVLRRLGVPVVVSRSDSGTRAGQRAVLVVAEPHLSTEGDSRTQRFGEMLGQAARVLLVLPKWSGHEMPGHPTWIDSAELLPAEQVEQVARRVQLDGVAVEPVVARLEGGCSTWHMGEALTGAPSPYLQHAQLLRDEHQLTPLIRCGEDMLLGEITLRETRVLVLSDPDLLSNQGLGRGDNAALVLAILALIREKDEAVVVDETLHGHRSPPPSVWRELFAYPLSVPVGHALLVVGVLLFATTRRFGTPLRRPPAIAPGKAFLIHNSAELVRVTAAPTQVLARYLDQAVKDVARMLHAPATRDFHDWLRRIGASRRVSVTLEELEREVVALSRDTNPSSSRLVVAANRIHRWRQEMIDGPSRAA